MFRPRCFLVALLILCLGLTAGASAGEDPVTLADYAWMTGTWKAKMPNGDELEEIWGQPTDRDLMGVFRWRTAEGQPRIYEILVITVTEGKPTIRLRHFHPDLTAWEEKDKPMVFVAESASKDKVVFKQTSPEGSKSVLTYERTGPDSFSATLDRGDGRALVMKFKKAS